MHHSPDTHCTWFNRNVEVTASQSIITQILCGITHRYNFSMGRGIIASDWSVVSLTNYLAIFNYDSPHRHFTPIGGLLS
jgi:hypothetical protein